MVQESHARTVKAQQGQLPSDRTTRGMKDLQILQTPSGLELESGGESAAEALLHYWLDMDEQIGPARVLDLLVCKKSKRQ